MAKKKSSAKKKIIRPRASQYEIPPTILRIGSDLRRYYVQEGALRELSGLAYSNSSNSGDKIVDLPDINAHTAHVIAHFLHTGTYQTLVDDEDEDTSFNSIKEFHKAASVYVAARKYGLHNLKELSKAELEGWGADVPISELVRTIGKKSYTALCDDSSWFEEFLLRKVETSFADDEDAFVTDDFFDKVASLALAKLVAQRVVKLYHDTLSSMRRQAGSHHNHCSEQNGISDAHEPSAHSKGQEIRDAHLEPVGQHSTASSESNVLVRRNKGFPVEADVAPSTKWITVPVPVEEPPESDSFAELKPRLKKKSKKQRKLEAAAKEREDAEREELEKEEAELVRFEEEEARLKVLEEEEIARLEKEEAELVRFEEEEARLKELEEEEIARQRREQEAFSAENMNSESLVDSWGFSATSSKKKKKKKRVAEEAPHPSSPPLPTPEPEPMIEAIPAAIVSANA